MAKSIEEGMRKGYEKKIDKRYACFRIVLLHSGGRFRGRP